MFISSSNAGRLDSSLKLFQTLEGLQQKLNSISILVPSSSAAAPVDADGVARATCGGVWHVLIPLSTRRRESLSFYVFLGGRWHPPTAWTPPHTHHDSESMCPPTPLAMEILRCHGRWSCVGLKDAGRVLVLFSEPPRSQLEVNGNTPRCWRRQTTSWTFEPLDSVGVQGSWEKKLYKEPRT